MKHKIHIVGVCVLCALAALLAFSCNKSNPAGPTMPDTGAFKPTTRIIEMWNGGKWQTYFKDIYTYNKAGQLLEEASFSWNGTMLGDTGGRILHIYNLLNQNIEDFWQDKINSGWITFETHLYTYDASGRLSEYVLQDGPSGSQNSHRDVYSYDGAGRVLMLASYDWMSDKWWLMSYMKYFYNDAGFLISALHETGNFPGDTILTLSDSVEYIYDAAGYNNRMTVHYRRNNLWQNASQRLYVYDGAGRLYEEVYQLWIDSAWVNMDRLHYFYERIPQPFVYTSSPIIFHQNHLFPIWLQLSAPTTRKFIYPELIRMMR